MPQTNELRLFISSTFRDLQDEREHLVKKIFPEIRALCRQRGITFTEVDLRWGLTDEDLALGQVIRTCLEEVDKCRPYFIGITGDRYGYVPSYLDIQKDPALLEQYPWIEDAALEGTSITEMEARYALTPLTPVPSPPGRGVASEASRGEGIRFYFRRHRETLDNSQQDAEYSQLLAYQQRIHDSGAPIEHFRDPASLGEMIYDDLLQIINNDFADVRPPTPLELERARHTAFAHSRRRAYIANPLYLKRLNDHIASDDAPLVVYAESGSGKSSLFAFWAEQYRRKHPDAHIIEHYVGIGASGTDHYAIIQHLCMEIKERFNREEDIPATPDELEKAFGQWLGYADHALKERSERMVLILDGLNQLQGTALNLRWIPDVISPSIRLILSSTVEGTLVEMKKRGWKQFGMQALSEAERETIVVRYLAEYRKALSVEQIKRIASDYKCGHPLFLKTLLEELRLIARHEELEQHIDNYLGCTGTEDLFQQVLERMEDDYSLKPVREVLSCLWVSHTGLDERELSELTGLSRLKITSMIAGLDYHLVRKGGYLTFFHDYLRRAVEKRYLGDTIKKQNIHGRLAEYFRRSEPNQRSAWEVVWGFAQSGDDAKVVEVLRDVRMLLILYTGNGRYDVLSQWSRLRKAGYDPEEVYTTIIDQELDDIDRADQLMAWEIMGDILQRLSLWSGAIAIKHRILTIAEAEGFGVQAANAEQTLGWILHVRGEYAEAMEYLERAVQHYRALNDLKGLSSTIGNMGITYLDSGKYDQAMECFERRLAAAEELGDGTGTSIAMGNIGHIFMRHGDFGRGLEYFERMLITAQTLGDRDNILTAIGNIGLIHFLRDDLDRAMECFQQGLGIAEDLGDRRAVSSTLGNIGMYHFHSGNYTRALELFQQSLSIAEELGYRISIASALGNMGLVHYYLGEYDRAEDYMTQQLQIEGEFGNRRNITSASGYLGMVYRDRGEYEKALEYIDNAIQGHRNLGEQNSVALWLAEKASTLLKLYELESMPDFVPHILSQANTENWQELLLQLARTNAEDCLAISREIGMMQRVFTGRFLLARIEVMEHRAAGEGADAMQRIHELFPEAQVDQQRAELHYWLWKFGDESHREPALRLFRTLLAAVPDHKFREYIQELEADNGHRTADR